jgi:hypothetical protein
VRYVFGELRSAPNQTPSRPPGWMEIEHLGAKVGDFASWSLRRRGEEGEDAALYDLRAVFRTISRALFDDPEYADWRRVTVVISSTKQYRLDQVVGMRTVLNGTSLLMEGVRLVKPLQKENT